MTSSAGFLLFFLMLVVPTAYTPVKAVLLVITLAAVIARTWMNGRLALHPAIAAGTLAFTAIGLVFVLRGVWLGAPGALRMAPVYVAWPLVYTMLISGAAEERVLVGLERLLIIALIVICLYSLSYVLWAAGWFPDALYLPLDQGQEVSFRAGVVEFRLYSIASLLFLVPFVIATFTAWPRDGAPVARVVVWGALLIGLVTTLLTGRRGLMMVVALAPALSWCGRRLVPDRRRAGTRHSFRKIGTAILALAVAVAVLRWTQELDLLALGRDFARGFQFSSDPAAMSRAAQYRQLVTGWIDAPLLGAGFGAVLPNFVRSQEMPWAFELSYAALLFNTGLLGFIVYGAGVAWIFGMSLRMVASGHRLGTLALPVIVGSAAFLVANASNPYLLKFDYEWVIFLPLAFVNAWLLDREPAPSRAAG